MPVVPVPGICQFGVRPELVLTEIHPLFAFTEESAWHAVHALFKEIFDCIRAITRCLGEVASVHWLPTVRACLCTAHFDTNARQKVRREYASVRMLLHCVQQPAILVLLHIGFLNCAWLYVSTDLEHYFIVSNLLYILLMLYMFYALAAIGYLR